MSRNIASLTNSASLDIAALLSPNKNHRRSLFHSATDKCKDNPLSRHSYLHAEHFLLLHLILQLFVFPHLGHFFIFTMSPLSNI